MPLEKKHDRSPFSSGDETLDHYLKHQATQEMRRKVAAVFVLVGDDDPVVKAYYTLSATTIILSDLPKQLQKKFPKYPSLPATLIGRLAVDQNTQGSGLGKFLLVDALSKAWRHAQNIASMAVVVDAIDINAVNFYQHYHFLKLTGHTNKLYLPMKEIDQLMQS